MDDDEFSAEIDDGITADDGDVDIDEFEEDAEGTDDDLMMPVVNEEEEIEEEEVDDFLLEEEEDEELFQDESDIPEIEVQPTSSCVLTKYERARIIGVRRTQLIRGAPPLVDIPEGLINIEDLAELELQAGRLPMIIIRPHPNGKKTKISVSNLVNIALN